MEGWSPGKECGVSNTMFQARSVGCRWQGWFGEFGGVRLRNNSLSDWTVRQTGLQEGPRREWPHQYQTLKGPKQWRLRKMLFSCIDLYISNRWNSTVIVEILKPYIFIRFFHVLWNFSFLAKYWWFYLSLSLFFPPLLLIFSVQWFCLFHFAASISKNTKFWTSVYFHGSGGWKPDIQELW